MTGIVVDRGSVKVCRICAPTQRDRKSGFTFTGFGVMLGVTLLELFNPPCGVHQFLLAGEKRMAGGTDLHLHLLVN
jgi:hypothetical protein